MSTERSSRSTTSAWPKSCRSSTLALLVAALAAGACRKPEVLVEAPSDPTAPVIVGGTLEEITRVVEAGNSLTVSLDESGALAFHDRDADPSREFSSLRDWLESFEPRGRLLHVILDKTIHEQKDRERTVQLAVMTATRQYGARGVVFQPDLGSAPEVFEVLRISAPPERSR